MLRPTQFSLSKLMLVVVACCIVAALLGRLQQVHKQAASLRRDLAAERDKNRAAQIEVGRQKREQEILYGRLGKLTIHNSNSIYLTALPARDEYEWKWRVYLPKGNRWRVVARHGIVSSDNRLAPDPDAASHFDSIVGHPGGEHEVDAFISRDLMQQRSVVVRIGDYTLRTPLGPVHERLILDQKCQSSLMQTGQAYHVDENNPLINKAPFPVTFPIGRVQLLLWRVMADSSQRGVRAIQIWIEPDTGPPLEFASGPPLESYRHVLPGDSKSK